MNPELSAYEYMDVVILAAGLGTRLRPITDSMPKVMLPIAEHLPLLEHTVRLLKAQGFKRFIFNLFYLPEKITEYFGDGSKFGVHIRYSIEEEILETAGAIKKMEPLIESDNFLLIYGDHAFVYDFRPLIDFHLSHRALGTLVLKRSDIPANGDLAELDPATKRIVHWYARPHQLTSFDEKLYLNTGLDIFSRDILSYIPIGRPVKLDGEILPMLITQEEMIYGFPTTTEILDIGTLEKYEAAKKWYAAQSTTL